jgi:sugar/nucleoside kinase (ribokinase family)
MALAATALASGVRCLCVTMGSRGVVYFAAPDFERLELTESPQAAAGGLARVGGAFGAIRTALVPAAPVRGGEVGDPTGCGDVWGATYFSRLLAGDMFTHAIQAAATAAARNVEHRGASGLAHYLRGELSAS